MDNSVALIEIFRLTKTFGSIKALNNVSLQFSEDNNIHGIVGPAGAGKTTLLRCMLKLLKMDSGRIEYKINGKTLPFSEVRANIAYMPQRQSLYADLSIEEHMTFFADLYGVGKKEYDKIAERLYKATQLEKFKNRPAGKLSGGMYKKLGLMCALLRSPKIILLDEPTNGVDPISRREFWKILNETAKNNVLIIMTTAYMDEVERCGCAHLMENGALLASGEPQRLLLEEKVDNFDQFFIKRATREEIKK